MISCASRYLSLSSSLEDLLENDRDTRAYILDLASINFHFCVGFISRGKIVLLLREQDDRGGSI